MRYTKRQRMIDFYARFEGLGFDVDTTDALRRIEMTLSRWAERECGDGSNWAIERDEETGKPFSVYHGEGKARRFPVADREAGALRRLAVIMAQHPDFVAYHQGDPRGCCLYVVAKKDLPCNPRLNGADLQESASHYYTRGFAVCY